MESETPHNKLWASNDKTLIISNTIDPFEH